MPTYELQAPDGNTYSIEGPPGATKAQVRAQVLKRNPNAGDPLGGYKLAPAEEGSLGIYERAGAALPSSLASNLSEMKDSLWAIITHPKETAKALQELGPTGIGQEIINDLSKHYGSIERVQKTFETDPTRILLDAFAAATGGPALLRKVGMMATKTVRTTVPKLASKLSGAAKIKPEAFEAAGEAGEAGGRAAQQYQRGVQIGKSGQPQPPGRIPYYQEAGEAIGSGGWTPQKIARPFELGGMLDIGQSMLGGPLPFGVGTAAGAGSMALSSPRVAGGLMYRAGQAERGLQSLPKTRPAIAAAAAAALTNPDFKKSRTPEELKTTRAAKRDDANSDTLLAAHRILEGFEALGENKSGGPLKITVTPADKNAGPVSEDASPIPSRQEGGPVAAGKAYRVGEQGQETFIPDRAEKLVSEAPMAEGIGPGAIDKLWDALVAGGKGLQEFGDQLREAGRAAFFEPEAYDPRAPMQAAGMVMGGGMPSALAREGTSLGVGGGKTLIHPISEVKLTKPLEEMEATYKGTPKPSKMVTPAQLQGGYVIPAIGDRSIAGRQLTGVGGSRLSRPVELQGGPGYMGEHAGRGSIWAAGGGIPTRLENLARKIETETGKPVYMAYSAMGHRSVDFAHHMSDTLSEMMKTARVAKKDVAAFDKAMRGKTADYEATKDWPGVQAKNLRQYLRNAGGNVRNKFAQMMDKKVYQDVGFPSVAEARHAVTDPRLLHEPIGASGIEIGRPTLARLPSGHGTYPVGMSGEHMGTLGASVPREHMFMDRFADIAASRSPERKFAMSLPVQEAHQHWVDTLSTFLRDHRGIALSATAGLSLPELIKLAEEKI